jgi:4-alpha-glucanotransferase
MTCVSTHDLPPLAGWWEGADVKERLALGLIASGSAAEEERRIERANLAEVLATEAGLVQPVSGEPSVAAVVEGAHAFIASTRCDLMLVQAEDLAGMRVGVNLPGTDTERPNWRVRLREPVETLFAGETAQSILNAVRAHGRATAESDSAEV